MGDRLQRDERDGDQARRRRTVIGWLIAGTAALPWAFRPSRTDAASVERTPTQTEGPYYPLDWSGDIDNDLVIVVGRPAPAKGQVLHIRGLVLNTADQPIPGVTVEIWQTDARGIYLHPEDAGPGRIRDANFQGRGRTVTDARGAYSFRTICPMRYERRTPHVHFKIYHPRYRTLITQMYERDEPLNARDGILRRMSVRHQQRVLVPFEHGDEIEKGALLARFNIVL